MGDDELSLYLLCSSIYNGRGKEIDSFYVAIQTAPNDVGMSLKGHKTWEAARSRPRRPPDRATRAAAQMRGRTDSGRTTTTKKRPFTCGYGLAVCVHGGGGGGGGRQLRRARVYPAFLSPPLPKCSQMCVLCGFLGQVLMSSLAGYLSIMPPSCLSIPSDDRWQADSSLLLRQSASAHLPKDLQSSCPSSFTQCWPLADVLLCRQRHCCAIITGNDA